uniref:Uncharacterized protein n=1 Tax=Glossina austeni TaxID=7395 RepID=A0A1A9UEG7_GLOAU
MKVYDHPFPAMLYLVFLKIISLREKATIYTLKLKLLHDDDSSERNDVMNSRRNRWARGNRFGIFKKGTTFLFSYSYIILPQWILPALELKLFKVHPTIVGRNSPCYPSYTIIFTMYCVFVLSEHKSAWNEETVMVQHIKDHNDRLVEQMAIPANIHSLVSPFAQLNDRCDL